MKYIAVILSLILLACSCSSKRTVTNAMQKDSISIKHYAHEVDSMAVVSVADVAVEEIGNILLVEEIEIYDTSRTDSLGNPPIKEKKKRVLGGSRQRKEAGTTVTIIESTTDVQDTIIVEAGHDSVVQATEQEGKLPEWVCYIFIGILGLMLWRILS